MSIHSSHKLQFIDQFPFAHASIEDEFYLISHRHLSELLPSEDLKIRQQQQQKNLILRKDQTSKLQESSPIEIEIIDFEIFSQQQEEANILNTHFMPYTS